MTEGKGLFKGEDHAVLYKKHRPGLNNRHLEQIIEFLAQKFKPSECDAVDVGCGSGQATLPLATFLRHVVGVDPSEAQISQINADGNIPANVEFRVGDAEALPFPDSSLQLITVKSALHWFDIPKFFKEVERVLQPGGVLAVSAGTDLGCIAGYEEESKKLLESLAKEHRSAEWTARANIVFNKYKDIKFPFDECICDDTFFDESSMTVRRLMDMALTRSDVAKFRREKPEEAEQTLKETEERLMKIIGATGRPEDAAITRRSQQILILCRKP